MIESGVSAGSGRERAAIATGKFHEHPSVMEALLAPGVPLDIALLDRVVEVFYDPMNPQVECSNVDITPPRLDVSLRDAEGCG